MRKLIPFLVLAIALLLAPTAQGHSTTTGNESYWYCRKSKTSHRHVHHVTPSKRHARRHRCHVHKRYVAPAEDEEGEEYPPAPVPPAPVPPVVVICECRLPEPPEPCGDNCGPDDSECDKRR